MTRFFAAAEFNTSFSVEEKSEGKQHRLYPACARRRHYDFTTIGPACAVPQSCHFRKNAEKSAGFDEAGDGDRTRDVQLGKPQAAIVALGTRRDNQGNSYAI